MQDKGIENIEDIFDRPTVVSHLSCIAIDTSTLHADYKT